ncbi:MAG: flagellar basal-body MS-ring/collar protein FliF [Buchnera aphidicola (Ceratovacuna japonica)]
MNEKLSFEKEIKKNNFFEFFFNIIKKNIIIFIILSSFFLTFIFSIFFLYSSTNYCTLYNNLLNEDKNVIISELSNMHIPYKINDAENKIKIPRNLIYEVRMRLSEKGIPKENINGFEILDKEKFGESQFHERINYQRALEGELAKTIMKIDYIKNASVRLVMNSKSIFVNNDIDASASVLLTVKYGKHLNINKINSILHLVSTSVSGLKYQNITIVDQYGNLLNQLSDVDVYNNSKLIYINDIEKKYKNKIEEILIPLFGINNVHAQVTAQIDFDKKEEVEEKYKPNSNIFDKSIRSNQSVYSKEFHSGSKSIGSEENYLKKKYDNNIKNNLNSNLHKKDINYKNNLNNIENNNNVSDHNGDYITNYDNTTNYELDHNIINTKINVGNLKRVSVGVVINYVKNSNGKFVPLNHDYIKKIRRLVKNSIGFSQDRGDTVDLVNSLFFNPQDNIKEKKIFIEKDYSNFFLKNFLFTFITVIFIILFYKLLFKKIFFYILYRKNKEKKNDKTKNKKIKKNKNVDEKILEKNKNVDEKILEKNKNVDEKILEKNKNVDEKILEKNKNVDEKILEKNKNVDEKILEKNKKKKISNALIVTKQNNNDENVFEKKSSFIAKIIRNWINKNE